MSQNINWLGNVYNAVTFVALPKVGGSEARFDDTSDADAVAADITNGKTAYVNGVKVVGTNSGGGSGKNAQIATGAGRAASSSYTDVGLSLTVAKTGTYNVYWTGYRSSTSGTNGAQLYVNGSSRGSAVTTFNSGSGLTNTQQAALTNISLNQGDVLTVRARSRGNNYYMYVMDLTIIEV